MHVGHQMGSWWKVLSRCMICCDLIGFSVQKMFRGSLPLYAWDCVNRKPLHVLHLSITSELEVAVHQEAGHFHDQEHSCTAPLGKHFWERGTVMYWSFPGWYWPRNGLRPLTWSAHLVSTSYKSGNVYVLNANNFYLHNTKQKLKHGHYTE